MLGDKKKLDKFDIEKHIMMHRVAEMELRTGSGGWYFQGSSTSALPSQQHQHCNLVVLSNPRLFSCRGNALF
jgi:hypothetical protein